MDDEINVDTDVEGEQDGSPSWQGPGGWVGPQQWFAGTLTPSVEMVFTHERFLKGNRGSEFYPKPGPDGKMHVFFCIIRVTHANQKVVIASGLLLKHIRIVTLDAALTMLKEEGTEFSPSPEVMATLNYNLKHLKL